MEQCALKRNSTKCCCCPPFRHFPLRCTDDRQWESESCLTSFLFSSSAFLFSSSSLLSFSLAALSSSRCRARAFSFSTRSLKYNKSKFESKWIHFFFTNPSSHLRNQYWGPCFTNKSFHLPFSSGQAFSLQLALLLSLQLQSSASFSQLTSELFLLLCLPLGQQLLLTLLFLLKFTKM